MRKMNGSSNYLRNQVWKNFAKASFCLLLFFLFLIVFSFRILVAFRFDVFDAAGLLISLVPLVAFFFYLQKYHIYKGGWAGEKQVISVLSGALSDDYFLLNNLCLRVGGGGDIDHVVLGPGGVFVLETKNWSGDITCYGDEWQRVGKTAFTSPSWQIKRNVMAIKNVVDSNAALRQMGLWVEGIIVFTNSHAYLHLNNPTVPVVKLNQLPNYLLSYSGSQRFSREKLEFVGKEILKHKN